MVSVGTESGVCLVLPSQKASCASDGGGAREPSTDYGPGQPTIRSVANCWRVACPWYVSCSYERTDASSGHVASVVVHVASAVAGVSGLYSARGV